MRAGLLVANVSLPVEFAMVTASGEEVETPTKIVSIEIDQQSLPSLGQRCDVCQLLSVHDILNLRSRGTSNGSFAEVS